MVANRTHIILCINDYFLNGLGFFIFYLFSLILLPTHIRSILDKNKNLVSIQSLILLILYCLIDFLINKNA